MKKRGKKKKEDGVSKDPKDPIDESNLMGCEQF